MHSTRTHPARLVATIATMLAIIVGLLAIATVPASAAAVEPEPAIDNSAVPNTLQVRQQRNRIHFNWWIATDFSITSFAVSFNGLNCTVARSGYDYGCTIYNTDNQSGTATLTKTMSSGAVVVVDTVQIEALAFGTCGALYRCPEISVTQYPDQVHFAWRSTSSDVASWIVTFAGQTCRVGHGQPGRWADFRCAITNTNDAGGVATLTYRDRFDTVVYNAVNIEPLGPGKCGATPRCVDAPINLSASTKGQTKIALDWQNFNGGESHSAGWKVEAAPAGGEWAAVCTDLLRNVGDYPHRGAAATECVVGDLSPGTSYRFRVASNGGGRANGMWAEASAGTQADYNIDYTWRATTNGTLYLGFTWSASITPRTSHSIAVDHIGRCGGDNGCEILVSKATGDALPDTFEARLEATDDSGRNTVQTITVTPPPARPLDARRLEVDASKTTATVSWDHPGDSTAVRYGVWLTGPGLPTCEVTGNLGGRESCRLRNLTPGTSYKVHVYAEDAIGQRSETLSISFRTSKDAITKPPKPDPKVAKCAADGQYTKTRNRIINKVNGWYDRQVTKATSKLEDRPMKLSRKLTKLAAKRDNKIAKANAKYSGRCG